MCFFAMIRCQEMLGGSLLELLDCNVMLKTS